jgi:hypothetical protein
MPYMSNIFRAFPQLLNANAVITSEEGIKLNHPDFLINNHPVSCCCAINMIYKMSFNDLENNETQTQITREFLERTVTGQHLQISEIISVHFVLNVLQTSKGEDGAGSFLRNSTIWPTTSNSQQFYKSPVILRISLNSTDT